MFRRILITGGSGQVGRALQALSPTAAQIAVPSSTELDIRNAASVRAGVRYWRPDAVVNAAAYTKVDQAEDEGELAFAVNAEGPGHLAKACAAARCPMLHISTDYVFDGAKPRPYVETDRPAPINLYGTSKLQGEQAVANALNAHLILRTSWVFSTTGSHFVRAMMHLADEEEIRVVNDQHGAPTSARSIAAAIWRILDQLAQLRIRPTHGANSGASPPSSAANRRPAHQPATRPGLPAETPGYGLYHFASQPATTWHAFAAAIFAQLAERDGRRMPRLVPIATADYPTKASRPLNSVLDGTRLQRAFALSAPDWRSDLKKTLNALQNVKS